MTASAEIKSGAATFTWQHRDKPILLNETFTR